MCLSSLINKRIVLGISGGVAAYKACDVVRRLREAGCEVRVVMTKSAAAFIGKLTLQALSGHPVYDALFDEGFEAAMGHIALARWADAIVIAPLSANCMSRLVQGQADDLLTTLCLAASAPVCLAPAMNQQMWQKPVTQQNLEKANQLGFINFGVGTGSQACGEVGPGRMLEADEIVAKLAAVFMTDVLSGQHVVITAGPTQEPIDPVRYLTNYSSGKMGYALAQAALDAGASVTLISGPVTLTPPAGVKLVSVTTACDMLTATQAVISNCDIFIATAAVSDYRPQHCEAQKIKKQSADKQLHLQANPDILATVTALPQKPFCVGFAAETEQCVENASKKLQQKKLDMICVNDVSQDDIGFASEENALTVLTAQQQTHVLAKASKTSIARQLIQLIGEYK